MPQDMSNPYNNQYGQMGMPQQNYVPMPDPSQYMMGQNYAQQTQYLANYSQSNLQQTMQFAQYNFHQHMQASLQGSMQAAMAIFSPVGNAMAKMNERMYNDILLPGGSYALERSFGREMAWGLGLANSELGRALKIGGRKPEFLSNGEYAFQMNRAVRHGREELMDMLLGGGASTAGSIAGMAFGPPGIIAGTAFGMVADATVGLALKPYMEHRKYNREFLQYTEMADLNKGAGQRRLSNAASEEMSDWMYNHDVSGWSHVPLMGWLGKRRTPDTKYQDTFKQMAQEGLLRDSDLNDVDKLKKTVSDTAAFVEKYAGILHTTKEAVMKMKGAFDRLGMNSGIGIGEVGMASLSTGLSAEQLMPLYQSYGRSGLAYGFNKDISAAAGIRSLSSTMAGIEGGMIDRMFDPGSFSQSLYSKSIGFSQTGYGKVIRHGMGSVGGAAAYYAGNGNGSTAAGYMLEGLPWLNDNQSSLDVYSNGINSIAKKFGRNEKGLAVAMSVMGAQSPEDKTAVYNAFYGLDQVSSIMAKASAENEVIRRTGAGISSVVDWRKVETSASSATAKAYSSLNSAFTSASSAKKFSETENYKEYDLYNSTKNKFGSELKNLYGSYIGGGYGSDSLRSSILDKMKDNGIDADMAERIINVSMNEQDQRQSKSSAMIKGLLNHTSSLRLDSTRNATMKDRIELDKANLYRATDYSNKHSADATYINRNSDVIYEKIKGMDQNKLMEMADKDFNGLVKMLRSQGIVDSVDFSAMKYLPNSSVYAAQDSMIMNNVRGAILHLAKDKAGSDAANGSGGLVAEKIRERYKAKGLDVDVGKQASLLTDALNTLSNFKTVGEARSWFKQYGSNMRETLRATHTSDSLADKLYDNMLSGLDSEGAFNHFKELAKGGVYTTASLNDEAQAAEKLGIDKTEMIDAIKAFTASMNMLNMVLGGH